MLHIRSLDCTAVPQVSCTAVPQLHGQRRQLWICRKVDSRKAAHLLPINGGGAGADHGQKDHRQRNCRQELRWLAHGPLSAVPRTVQMCACVACGAPVTESIDLLNQHLHYGALDVKDHRNTLYNFAKLRGLLAS